MSLKHRLISLIPHALVKVFARPYIAGDSLIKAISCAEQLFAQHQLHTTLDLLGEGIQNADDIANERQQYLDAIDQIQHPEYITFSLKPTQMGLGLDDDLCTQNIRDLLVAAAPKNIHITIDMEESKVVSQTLELYRTLRQDHENVGTVLQSRLFRTQDDIPTYLDGHRAHIRLCLGIYVEPKEIAYTRKKDMKDNFMRLLEQLFAAGHYVGIATHDTLLIQRSLELIERMGITPQDCEFQMLLGVPRHAIQQQLIAQGYRVRIYLPYATQWSNALAYSQRRLIENPMMGMHVLKNLFDALLRRFRSSPKLPPST
ncbi:MAG: proline dehydrogenase family protein [Myxococcota bacterium]